MSTWNSRGLRGSTLEEMINSTNEVYRKKKLALVQKIPTPITPVEFDQESRRITKAFFEKDSTVDYIGVVQEIPICFDAKECHSDTFSLQNIHEHQYEFMKEFEEQGGISFIILLMTHKDEAFYIPFKDIDRFIRRREKGGRKSFTYNEIDKSYEIDGQGGLALHFLPQIAKDLESRE